MFFSDGGMSGSYLQVNAELVVQSNAYSAAISQTSSELVKTLTNR
jgi:hypothetical protein